MASCWCRLATSGLVSDSASTHHLHNESSYTRSFTVCSVIVGNGICSRLQATYRQLWNTWLYTSFGSRETLWGWCSEVFKSSWIFSAENCLIFSRLLSITDVGDDESKINLILTLQTAIRQSYVISDVLQRSHFAWSVSEKQDSLLSFQTDKHPITPAHVVCASFCAQSQQSTSFLR